jgi:hypothetical protein
VLGDYNAGRRQARMAEDEITIEATGGQCAEAEDLAGMMGTLRRRGEGTDLLLPRIGRDERLETLADLANAARERFAADDPYRRITQAREVIARWERTTRP